jgi:hypothetical protein
MACLAAMVLVFSAVTAADAQSAELEFLAPDAVTANLSGETSKEWSVWLENSSDRVVVPEFKVVLENSDGETAPATVEVSGEAKSIGANQVTRFRLTLTEASKSSGQLVALADGLSPASVPISVGPELDLSRGVNGALIIPFILAFILMIAAAIYGCRDADLLDAVGTAELEFSKSFATTLTAVGALLGTIIAAGVLPEDTVNLSKAGFTGLNLTFGIAVVVAGVVYSGIQRAFVEESDGKKAWKLKGFVIPFLIAALITVWAVFGELWTMWRLVEELGREEGFTDFAVTVVQVMLAIAALSMIPYTLIRVRAAIRRKPDDTVLPAPTVVQADDLPPPVSLL